MRPTAIIIPTLDNLRCVVPCVRSIAKNTVGSYRFLIINQGTDELYDVLKFDNDADIVKNAGIFNVGKPIGWMGAINYGIERIAPETEYVIFMNDDTVIPPGHFSWLTNMGNVLSSDKSVGAVGPSSNFVSGWQNMIHMDIPLLVEVKYLIGFCMMVRRSVLDEVGVLDATLPGGDDLDFSIRLRDAGYKLIARRDSFVFHEGQVTGKVTKGDDWDSERHRQASNIALIQKHGFKKFIECVRNQVLSYEGLLPEYGPENCLRSIVKGKGADIGCGKSKEPESIGVDIDPNKNPDIVSPGDVLPFQDGELDYIVSRHSIEHFFNPVKTLKEWRRVLKKGGMLGITTPDGHRWRSIEVDGDHKHQFDRSAIKDLLELTGFEVESMDGCGNQLDFYCIARAEK